MYYGDSSVTQLDEQQCRERLAGEELGRLAVNVRDRLDIYPVNFVYDKGDIYFRTAPGTKLLELTIHSEVVFEVDGHTDADAWSVVARGTAERIERDQQIEEAYQLPLRPWIPTLKMNWVRIRITQLTGRYFAREPEPDSE